MFTLNHSLVHHTDYLWHCSKVSWMYATGLWLLHLEQKKILQGPFKFMFIYVLQNFLKAFHYCPFSWSLSCTDKLSCLRCLVSCGRAIGPPICQQAETHSPPRLQCATALLAWMSACTSSGPFPAKHTHIHTLRLAVLINWLEHTGSWVSSVIIISL